jgi:beta-phosphoglucomutase-like phosphatase (HAD superfamily)
MIEGKFDRHEDFDPSLFSEEELAMMRGADGVTDSMAVRHNAKELQAQYTAVAQLVAEGGERERKLRSVIADLSTILKANEAQASLYEQTQNLAKIVLASSERESEMQHSLEALRTAVLARAKSLG